MTGWLVVNKFLASAKFSEIFEWLEDSAARHGIELIRVTNAELMNVPGRGGRAEGRPDFVLFWDKDVRLAERLEADGFRLFNSARAIETCDDKSLTYVRLKKSGVPMPETLIAPMTFHNIGYTDYEFLRSAKDALGFPMVVKESYGSFGKEVYLARDMNELREIVQSAGGRPLIFQEYVKSSHGIDIRINIVGGEVIASMLRRSVNGDFRANVTNGGKMETYTPTDGEAALAIRSCEALELDFAGIDILFGADGEPVFCEANSNSHFKNIYDCTGINVADAMFKYILRKIG